MAKKQFTENQWADVNELLAADPERFGMPARRNDSVVLASFNIRKIGKVAGRSGGAWQFLADFCRNCDLIAVQEVQDNLDGLNFLKGLLGEAYGLVASDVTGWKIGARSMVERLAFLFHWSTVERTEVASDITYDRSAVLGTLYEERAAISKALKKHTKDLKDWQDAGGDSDDKPPLVLPTFLTFMRTPFCVSFRVPGLGGADPYEFLAVNAHLLYGDATKQAKEREMEFWALMAWMLVRAKKRDRLYHENLMLFGDLNLDFKAVDARRVEIETRIKKINKTFLKSKKAAKINFPFLDVHPDASAVFRTNARLDQTYDQIGLFAHDKRLPPSQANDDAGQVQGGFDYGMLNFVELFAEAMHGSKFKDLTGDQRKVLLAKFEHDVSDHMPIWIRLPKPFPGQPGS
jgi:endonuclease/exonuclease/phosphatase family metal-dependent hydrolase